MTLLTKREISAIGFRHTGRDVKISAKASFYGASRISIGDHCRIDDFCVLSAGAEGIELGRYIHLAVYSSLIGKGAIRIGEFGNISSRVSIYSSSDDYSGRFMTNPTVDERFTNVAHAPVLIGRHVIIGANSVVLPGVSIGDGVAIGALSLVKRNCRSFGIYAGVPARFVKRRSRRLLTLERAFLPQGS